MARELIKEALFLLNITGLNPLNNSLRCKTVIVAAIFSTLFLIEVFLTIVFNWNGTESLDSINIFVGCYMVLVKLIALFVYRKKFAMVLENIDKHFWKLNKYGTNFQNKALRSYKFIRIAMLTTATFFVTTGVTFYLKPIFSDKRTLPAEIFYPTDYNNTFVYILIYIIQVIICCKTAYPVLFGFDCLLISFIVHIVHELNMVKIGFRTVAINTKQKKEEKQALHELNRLIDHHNLILQCIQYMRESYSIVLLNQFVSSLFIMGVSLLSAMSKGFPPDMANLARSVPYLLSYMMGLFFYCYGGTVLITESKNVADAAYGSFWWAKTQPEFRRRVVLAIQRAQKVEKLTAGGMYDLNLEGFAQIMSSTYSFVTLAQAVLTKPQENQ